MSAVEINAGQLGIRYLIDGSETASLGMFELTVPPGSNVPPPHSHSNNEEIVYVLEGTLRYTVGSDTRDLTSGQSMQTPRGTAHAFSNPHGSVARALIVLYSVLGSFDQEGTRPHFSATSSRTPSRLLRASSSALPGAML